MLEVVRDGETIDKAPEKPAEKSVAKPEKAPEKPAAKPAEKTPEKTADKAIDKTRAEEAKRAAAILTGQAGEAKPAAAGAST